MTPKEPVKSTQDQFEELNLKFRELGFEIAKALRLPEFVGWMIRYINARPRLRIWCESLDRPTRQLWAVIYFGYYGFLLFVLVLWILGRLV